MNNLGGPELVLILLFSIPLFVIFVGVAPYVTWRRGGSSPRVVLALLVSLIPYIGWIVGAIVALTTKRTNGFTGSTTGREEVALAAGAPARQVGAAGKLGKIV